MTLSPFLEPPSEPLNRRFAQTGEGSAPSTACNLPPACRIPSLPNVPPPARGDSCDISCLSFVAMEAQGSAAPDHHHACHENKRTHYTNHASEKRAQRHHPQRNNRLFLLFASVFNFFGENVVDILFLNWWDYHPLTALDRNFEFAGIVNCTHAAPR